MVAVYAVVMVYAPVLLIINAVASQVMLAQHVIIENVLMVSHGLKKRQLQMLLTSPPLNAPVKDCVIEAEVHVRVKLVGVD